ncbi:MAG: hypothetical protein LBQ79_01595 [Deltaproteobacteria bacterium]|jgi:hypothetical protein|nr:hypothetical protein [Deltaproteobacteria bacterium]
MTATEDKLRKIALEVLAMDEGELMQLLPGYQDRMENYASIHEWEEAVLLYFLINGYRIKNIQFCERVNQLNARPKPPRDEAKGRRPRAELSLIPPPEAGEP